MLHWAELWTLWIGSLKGSKHCFTSSVFVYSDLVWMIYNSQVEIIISLFICARMLNNNKSADSDANEVFVTVKFDLFHKNYLFCVNGLLWSYYVKLKEFEYLSITSILWCSSLLIFTQFMLKDLFHAIYKAFDVL